MSANITQVNRLVPGLIEPVGTGKTDGLKQNPATGSNFSDLLSNFINSVNDTQNDAARMQNALLAGEPVELHDVMIKAEEAGLSMDLLLEIRNRLLSAYNDLIKMPI